MPPVLDLLRQPLTRWAIVLVPLTAWLFLAMQAMPIDPTNSALEARGTAAARDLRRLAAAGVSLDVVLLAFQVPGDLPIVPVDQARIDACRDRIAAMPQVTGCELLPETEPGLALMTAALEPADAPGTADRVVAAARRDCPASMRLLATGIPLYQGRIAELVAADRLTIVPLIGLALFAVALLLYRSVGLALATLAPAGAAIVWTTGLTALLGHSLDPIAALLDPVLLTIGVATSVHFLEAWRRLVAAGHPPHEASRLAGRRLRTPVALATVTTMVGLLSMATNSVPAVADFGVRAAVGIALLHTFVFTWFPALLAATKARPRHAGRRGGRAASWTNTLDRHRGWLAPAAVTLTVIAAAGLPRLTVDNDPLTMLPRSEACRADHDELAAHLGGVEAFHLYAPPGSPGTRPDRMLPFVADAQRMAGIAGPGGAPLRGLEGDVAVPLLLRPGGSSAREVLFDDLERAAKVCGLEGLVTAGPAVRMARDSNDLIAGLLRGTAVVFLLLVVGMCLGLRSVRLGLVGAIPMVMACLWVYGAMGWAGHPVSVATGMIGCTMLGLIVDNVLHFLHRYRESERAHGPQRALDAALRETGRPIWLSSGLLIGGFATAATSRLTTTIEFSLLACSTIAIALFGTVVVVPLSLGASARRRERNAHAL